MLSRAASDLRLMPYAFSPATSHPSPQRSRRTLMQHGKRFGGGFLPGEFGGAITARSEYIGCVKTRVPQVFSDEFVFLYF
jgi:hypothetical protein